jgi:DmsE family decaheme c-type cytochrome
VALVALAVGVTGRPGWSQDGQPLPDLLRLVAAHGPFRAVRAASPAAKPDPSAASQSAAAPAAQSAPAPQAAATTSNQAAATPMNNEDCAVCHEDLAKGLERTRHGILEKSPRMKLKNSCESCHGPGEAHATGDGDKTKIIGFNAAASRTYNRQCLACHKTTHALAGFGAGPHAKANLSCADCHAIHKPLSGTSSLKVAANQLCVDCHTQSRAQFAKPFHHRVNENAMRCVDCHEPHGGLERRQTRTTATGEAACVKCHGDKTGPFVFEHASMRIQGCVSCHESHGSNNARMLVRATVRSLCLECHSTSTSAVFGRQTTAFHDVRSPRYQNCTTCHARIHGSNASRLFLQ